MLRAQLYALAEVALADACAAHETTSRCGRGQVEEAS